MTLSVRRSYTKTKTKRTENEIPSFRVRIAISKQLAFERLKRRLIEQTRAMKSKKPYKWAKQDKTRRKRKQGYENLSELLVFEFFLNALALVSSN